MSKLKHAGYWKSKVHAYNGDVAPAEIDRLQDLRGSPTIPIDFLYEIGRKAKLGVHKRTPEVSLSMRQFEYGSLEFYRKLANKADAASGVADEVNLDDFSTSFFDIVGYEGESEEVCKASILFPKCRLNGFGLNIADPNAIIERTFDITSDNKIIWQNNNLYWIYKREIVQSGDFSSGASVEFTITSDNYPTPVIDPDNAKYFYRILRYRGTETTKLTSSDYTYNSVTNVVTILSCEVGDVIKFYYTASAYITGTDYHTLNDTDADALYAYNSSIYLVDGLDSDYVYRMSSLGLSVSFDRVDVKELGNKETVETVIKNSTVSVTTSGLNSGYTFEEILRGKSGLSYGKIDMEKFLDSLKLIVEIYSDSDKDNFVIGYTASDLTPTSLEKGVPVQDLVTKGCTLDGDALKITTDKTNLWA